jgi:hypothetical protein
MSFLSFLSEAQVEDVKVRKGGGGGARKPWNPDEESLAIRVWKDGSVYPSKALVARFDLEYPDVTITKGELWPYSEEYKKEYEAKQAALPEDQRKPLADRYKPSLYEPISGKPGNGFDVIDSRHWGSYKGAGNMLFIAPVGKDQTKVDLFGGTKYTEDGKPMSSVMDQGSKTYGEEMLDSLKAVYGIELTDEKPYVDLLIIDEIEDGGTIININERFSKPVALFPKTVKRGKEAGKPDTERRENAVVYALLPADMMQAAPDGKEEAKEEANATV